MIDSQNIDKLSSEAINLIAWAFDNLLVGWDICHAIEVRVDEPVSNLLTGGAGLITHAGGDSRTYIKHYGDDEWAIVHHRDETWNKLMANSDFDRAAKAADDFDLPIAKAEGAE